MTGPGTPDEASPFDAPEAVVDPAYYERAPFDPPHGPTPDEAEPAISTTYEPDDGDAYITLDKRPVTVRFGTPAEEQVNRWRAAAYRRAFGGDDLIVDAYAQSQVDALLMLAGYLAAEVDEVRP